MPKIKEVSKPSTKVDTESKQQSPRKTVNTGKLEHENSSDVNSPRKAEKSSVSRITEPRYKHDESYGGKNIQTHSLSTVSGQERGTLNRNISPFSKEEVATAKYGSGESADGATSRQEIKESDGRHLQMVTEPADEQNKTGNGRNEFLNRNDIDTATLTRNLDTGTSKETSYQATPAQGPSLDSKIYINQTGHDQQDALNKIVGMYQNQHST